MTTAEPHDRRADGVAATDVASWLATEMRAACEEPIDSSFSSDSAVKAIKECAQLLSRVWPVGGTSGECLRPSRPAEGLDSQTISPLKGDERLGRFEIRKQLGYGGFGVVFLAYDPHLGREAALKIPRPEILVSSQLRQRFLREAHAAALLDHPGIVPIYETGEIGPITYILSAYCKGPTLAAWLKERTDPATVSIAATVTACLADAVQHAHDRGVLHRDLKPANVLLEPGEGLTADFPFYPRLSDFGLAKRIESTNDLTQAGALLGTPRYMAPEQARGDERSVGVQTDVYSLGIILYELLAGAPPIIGGTDLETLRKIEEEEPTAGPLRNRSVPADLETICLKCLEKQPANRYQSARELADDLRRFLAGDPVHARPIGVRERLVRWCYRKPVVAALTVGLAAAITAGGIAASTQWLRAERNLVAARESEQQAQLHLDQAEKALFEFAWIIEESSLWSDTSTSVRAEIEGRLNKYYNSHIKTTEATPLSAAIESFSARSGALSGQNPTLVADQFERALKAWSVVLAASPTSAEYPRAYGLCIFNYAQFLAREAEKAGEPDTMTPIRQLIARTAKESAQGGRVLSTLATVLLERGDMHYNDREERQARQAHAVGLLAAEELVRLSSSPEYSLLAARLYRAVGSDLRRANDVPAALQSVHRSRELLEQLPAEDPPNQHRMEEQAEVYRLLGFMERGQKHYPIALDWLGRAVRLNEQLVAANRNQSSLMRLASSLDNIASVHAALGRNDDEFKALRQCRETMREALAMGDSLNPQAKRFGQVCHRLGKLANELGDSETARSAFEEGAAAFEKLATERDLTADGTLNRAECHAFLAAHLAAAGDKAAAIASYELAVKLLKRTGTSPDADPRHKDRYRKSVASLNDLKSQP